MSYSENILFAEILGQKLLSLVTKWRQRGKCSNLLIASAVSIMSHAVSRLNRALCPTGAHPKFHCKVGTGGGDPSLATQKSWSACSVSFLYPHISLCSLSLTEAAMTSMPKALQVVRIEVEWESVSGACSCGELLRVDDSYS